MRAKDSALRLVQSEGEQASQLLDHPLIKRFLIEMKGDLLNEFQLSSLESDEARLNAWQKSQILQAFEKKFIDSIKVGNHAKLTLMERAKQKVRSLI